MTVPHLACGMGRTRTYRRRMIRLLAVGQCAIELDGKRLTAESEVVFGLLLYLAARAGEAISRDDAQALLWPDVSHTRGRHCLRQAAYRLRQLGVPLRADNGSLGVAFADVTSDFASLTGNDVPAAAYANQSVGEILPGYLPAYSTPFAAWVEEYRTRIANRLRQGLVRAIVDLRSKGRYREAEPLARVCLTSDPFNEIATLTLAEATAVLSGNRAEALAILDRYMDEVGTLREHRLALSASVLRRRISEQFVEQRYAAPPEPPFVGREEVLQLMVEKMQEAVAGRSSLVYLWGEPGIGKTRLLEELAKVAHVQGVRVERYTVTPNDPDRALALFSSILPRMMNMAGAVGISPEAYQAIQRFIDPSAWERVEPPRSAAEAALVFGRLKAGIGELFEALADERPLGLLVDDAHWADQRSLEVLSEVVERLRGRRVAFVLTSRETCNRKSRALEALCARAAVRRLDGLDAGQVESLLERIADQRNFTLSSEFVRRTLDTSAGNPLFVSELATHYCWNGVRDALPHNMQTLLQKRLDALSPEALLLFQVCAVLGEHATVERMGKVLQAPMHVLLPALAEVERASLLATLSERVTCRHELLRREAIARLKPIACQALLHKVASVLERAALRQMNPSVCWHAIQTWLAAKESDRALKLAVTMASRMLASGLARDADAFLQTARNALGGSSAGIAAILRLQGFAARAVGDLKRSLTLAVECQQLGDQGGLTSEEARLAEFAAFDATRVLELGHSGIPLYLTRLQESDEAADVLTELALRVVMEADDQLEPAAAKRCFEALTARRVLPRASRDIRNLFELAYHSHYGNIEVALARARQILANRNDGRTHDPSTESRRLRWAHRPLALAGWCDDALTALDQSVLAARRYGSAFDETIAESYRFEVLFWAGRLDEAAEVFANLETRWSESDTGMLRFNASVARAYMALARGQPAKLRAATDGIEAVAGPRPVRRVLAHVDSLRVFECLLEGVAPEAHRVARLIALWQPMRSVGSADLAFMALTAALLTQGEVEHATQLCLEYQPQRRERSALPSNVVFQFNRMLQVSGADMSHEVRCFLSGASH